MVNIFEVLGIMKTWKKALKVEGNISREELDKKSKDAFRQFLLKLKEINDKKIKDIMLSGNIDTCIKALNEDNLEVFNNSVKLIKLDIYRIARGQRIVRRD